ncbi:MAG: hypothetical protein AB7P97_21545 [Hyphomonadaceae bacterium]
MNELPYIAKWLTETLKEDATLIGYVAGRVYNDQPPSSPVFPLIRFNFMAGRDVQGNGTVRVMTRPLFQIKTIVRGPMSEVAQSIADRIDTLIQNASSVVFEGFIFSARREQPIAYPESGPDPEIRFLHLGGLYRIDTQKV